MRLPMPRSSAFGNPRFATTAQFEATRQSTNRVAPSGPQGVRPSIDIGCILATAAGCLIPCMGGIGPCIACAGPAIVKCF